ncbi:MAG: hypothetical protein U0401_29250 [Anaerolineae bacterium]
MTGSGPVILVQIENEHWASGVYGHDAHQETLAQAMQEQGVTMPLHLHGRGQRLAGISQRLERH